MKNQVVKIIDNIQVIDIILDRLPGINGVARKIVLRLMVFNFNRSFKKEASGGDAHDRDINKMKSIIFHGKPKRLYKSNANTDALKVTDPKRVH
jgi:hypothetical protein